VHSAALPCRGDWSYTALSPDSRPPTPIRRPKGPRAKRAGRPLKLQRFTRPALLLGALGLLLWPACSLREPAPRPNIVLVISDDQGWADFGFMGSEIARTPHMDSIATEGVVFTHGFNTSSACRASLQTLLTGYSPLRFRTRAEQLIEAHEARGEGGLREVEIIAEMQTLPRLLERAGYASFQAGKYWEGTWRNGGFSAGMKDRLNKPWEGGKKQLLAAAGGPSTEFGRESLDPMWRFIDEDRGESPFFVWFAPMLPHVPHDAPPEFRAIYEGEAAASLSPSALGYFANVSRLDARVGELLEGLERRGLRRDTLVVLLSDNGWQQEAGVDWSGTKLGGGPRAKFSLYELGFRTPIVFSWPARLSERHVRSELVSTEDVFSTVLDILELPAPSGRDGISLWPILRGAPGPHRRAMVASMPDGALRRDKRWSLVWHEPSGNVELYDMEKDPDQHTDIAADHPDVVDTFRNEITRWRRSQSRPL